MPYSTALHATLDGRAYLTGPLARYSISSASLSETAREAAAAAGLGAVCRNPFRSIVVRAMEAVYAADEALRIIDELRAARAIVRRGAASRRGGPRGQRGTARAAYHRYQLDAAGRIESADIIPPTSQNQAAIEANLRSVVAAHLDLDDDALTALCERTIRNYDPCISCSAHFLDLRMERR